MKIIFVDDEQMILNGIKRALFRTGWDIVYATSGSKALDILKDFPADFIVSDMLMPGMNGAELLEKVNELYPSIVRIILSGHADAELSVRASYVAHQWFNKPCSPDTLKTELAHIHQIRSEVPYKTIQTLVGGITTLPTVPSVFIKIKSMLSCETISMEAISSLISESQSLTTKVLQVANSSFFASNAKVTSVESAIIRLGVDVVCNIVAVTEAYSTFDDDKSGYYNEILQRGLKTAQLAVLMVDKPLREQTMLAALLHNIGELILCQIEPNQTDTYLKERVIGADNSDLEIKLFQVSSIQITSYLLHLWHFPYSLVESIALQNNTNELIKHELGSAAAIYISKTLVRQLSVDEEIIKHFAISTKLEQWRTEI